MKILFVTHCFPPSPEAGAARTRSLAKYLALQGNQVDVVTVAESQVARPSKMDDSVFPGNLIRKHEVRSPFSSVDPYLKPGSSSLFRFFGGCVRRALRFFHLDAQCLWGLAVKRYLKGLDRGSFDLILTSGNPWTNFSIAAWLGKRWRKPYVLDYRDLWTMNPHQKSEYPAAVERRERNIVAGAAGISTVSPRMAGILKSRAGKQTRVIACTNGFDDEEMAAIRPYDFGEFTIVYAGTFYAPARIVDPLFEALRLLKAKHGGGIPWRFQYFGTRSDYVNEKITEYGLQDVARSSPPLSRKEALARMAGASVNVVITTVHPRGNDAELGIVTSKIFDSLGLGVPVLLIAPENSDAGDILAKAKGGHRFSGTDIEGIAGFLSERMQLNDRVQPADAAAFCWSQMIQPYNEFLKSCVAGGRA
jgi:glycosyltransferase involved in cell wall biosynthesis